MPLSLKVAHSPVTGKPSSRGSKLLLTIGVLALGALAMLTGAAQQSAPGADKPNLLPEANRPAESEAKTTGQPAAEAPANEQKKQLSDESAKLLALATALKAEVDKTNKDMLSVNVVRKADEIEKLAHHVKEKMKTTAGGS